MVATWCGRYANIGTLQFEVIVFIVLTPLHRGSGRRKWILHKFSTRNCSSLFSATTDSSLWFRITSCGVVFITFQIYLFFPSPLASKFTCWRFSRTRLTYAPYYQELRRGCIYQMQTFWKRMEKNQRYNEPKLKKYLKKKKSAGNIRAQNEWLRIAYYKVLCVLSEHWISEYKFPIK